MKELRNTLSTTKIPQTGTLTVVHVLDFEKLRKEHGDTVPIEKLEAGGSYLVRHELAGKTKTAATLATRIQADCFVAGADWLASVRKRRAKKAPKETK